MFLSILTSGFDLILGSFFDFLGLQGAIFGDFVLGDYFLRVFCPMDFLLLNFGGFCPKGLCLKGFCPSDFLTFGFWIFVLENFMTSGF